MSKRGPQGRAGGESGSDASPAASADERRPRTLALDQTFEILKNERRRYVLRYLQGREGSTSLGELSEQIAAWENDTEVRRITSTERKRVYVALYQCHLPKMDDMAVVEFAKNRGTIEPGPNLEPCCQYLDVPDSSGGTRWPRYYVLLSVLAVIALLGALALEPVLPVPAVGVAVGLTLVGFGSLSASHYLRERRSGG